MAGGGQQPAGEWLRDAVLYQIYPQSFADADGDGVGDLAGILDRLDYLAWLGVDTVWLSPCFVSPFCDAGYDISDYVTIAPRYGSNADLVELVEQARRRGIRILLDLVVGHTSDEHPWYLAARDDPGDDRYIWCPEPGPSTVLGGGRRGGFFVRNFLPCQPALNFGYARLDPAQPWRQPVTADGPRANRAMVREVMAHWLSLGVAGFRCDMAYSLVKDDPDHAQTSSVWREVRAWLDREHPYAALVSEWGQPERALPAGFHADFFLQFHGPVVRSLWDDRRGTVRNPDEVADPPLLDPAGRGSLETFAQAWASVRQAPGLVVLPSANHDFTRLASLDRGAPELAAAFALLLTLPTVPAIYYGDEIGMRFLPGLPDKEGSKLRPHDNRAGSRSPMQWDEGINAGFSTAPGDALYLPVDPRADRPTVAGQRADPDSLLWTVRSLVGLRRRHGQLRTGSFEMLCATGPVAYRRGEDLLVVVNPSGIPAALRFPGFADARTLIARRGRLDGDEVRLEPYGFGIYDRSDAVEELVALYEAGDLSGRVVGAAARAQVRARNLPHAATAVLLRDAAGRVYVHRRTDTKDIYPGMHDAFAGGVVLAGEEPESAAVRELAEELGVHDCPLTLKLRFWYADGATSYLAFVYEAAYDPDRSGPIVHQPSEVAEGWWSDWDDLLTRLADPTWPFVPDGRLALARYQEWG